MLHPDLQQKPHRDLSEDVSTNFACDRVRNAADAVQISGQFDPRKHRLFLIDRDIRTAREAVVEPKL